MSLPTAASVVSSGLAAYPSIYYDRAGVAVLHSNLALYNALDLKTMPDRNGVVMQLFDHSKMAANTTPVTEGTPFSGQTINQNTRQISLVQYADYISISDKVDRTQLIDQGKAASELLGYRGALSVDNLIAAVLEAQATADTNVVIDVPAASYVTTSKIRQAVFGLRSVDTPAKANGLYFGVTHSLIAFDILNDNTAGGFIDVWKYNDSQKAISNGISANYDGQGPNKIATIAGAELFESNNVPSYSNYQSSGHTAYATYIVGRNAIFGASLGKTQLGQKNFSVEMRRYDQGNSLDPAALIRAAVVYNFSEAIAA